jgi:hypothetical protein
VVPRNDARLSTRSNAEEQTGEKAGDHEEDANDDLRRFTDFHLLFVVDIVHSKLREHIHNLKQGRTESDGEGQQRQAPLRWQYTLSKTDDFVSAYLVASVRVGSFELAFDHHIISVVLVLLVPNSKTVCFQFID